MPARKKKQEDIYEKWQRRFRESFLILLGAFILSHQAFIAKEPSYLLLATGLLLVGAIPAWRINDWFGREAKNEEEK